MEEANKSNKFLDILSEYKSNVNLQNIKDANQHMIQKKRKRHRNEKHTESISFTELDSQVNAPVTTSTVANPEVNRTSWTAEELEILKELIPQFSEDPDNLECINWDKLAKSGWCK